MAEDLKKKVDNLANDFNKHIEKLNKKYQKVMKENAKNEAMLNIFIKIIPNIIIDGQKEELLYFSRIGKIFYLDNSKKNICLVCGKRRKTTAHHLIPKRAGCTNKILKELRVRVCKECDKKVHPEHSWVPQAIKKRDKRIEVLRERVKEAETPKVQITEKIEKAVEKVLEKEKEVKEK